MIAIRERWLADNGPSRKAPKLEMLIEPDPDNVDAALLLLGIAERAPPWGDNDRYDRLLLVPWAVQTALSRPDPS